MTWRYCKKDQYVFLDVKRQHLCQCKISHKLGKAVACHDVESGCKGNYKQRGWLLGNIEKRMAGK